MYNTWNNFMNDGINWFYNKIYKKGVCGLALICHVYVTICLTGSPTGGASRPTWIFVKRTGQRSCTPPTVFHHTVILQYCARVAYSTRHSNLATGLSHFQYKFKHLNMNQFERWWNVKLKQEASQYIYPCPNVFTHAIFQVLCSVCGT
jgi:hypothetical protein